MSYDTSRLHGVALVGTDQKLTVELSDLRISFHAELLQLSEDQNISAELSLAEPSTMVYLSFSSK